MPTQAPVFRHAGWKPREPWERPAGWKDTRLRGRPGMRERAEVLAGEPLCRVCKAQGKLTPAEEVDHIVPLAWGGSDVRRNKQALCKPCHGAKSAAERLEGRRGRG